MKILRTILILIVTYFYTGIAGLTPAFLVDPPAAKSPTTEMSKSSEVLSKSALKDPSAKVTGQATAKPTAQVTEKSPSQLKVVVSIAPFYALVSEIMKDVGPTPKLLVKSGASAHHAVLSPQDVKTLDEADIIFWGGPDLETFLINPLKIVKSKQKTIVELDKTPGIQWLDTRYSPDFNNPEKTHAADDHDHAAHDHSHHSDSHADSQGHDHEHSAIDMHFWLDPDNALVLIDNITNTLSQAAPASRAQFEKNASALKTKIKETDAKLKHSLAPIRSKPYLVFHDGYHYFEHHYGLNAVGAITHHPELPVSIERLKKIREIIDTQKVECVFSEPNTNPKLVQSLAKDFHLRMGVLDPLENPQALENDKLGILSYPELLEGISNSLVKCLEQK